MAVDANFLPSTDGTFVFTGMQIMPPPSASVAQPAAGSQAGSPQPGGPDGASGQTTAVDQAQAAIQAAARPIWNQPILYAFAMVGLGVIILGHASNLSRRV